MADETYEVVAANETHQIPNPEWREFTRIFKSGKKVSLRNVQQVPVATDDQFASESLSIAKDSQAHDVQKQLWKDPAMLNFYEYLSTSGAFNIPQLAPEMWHRYEDQYAAGNTDEEQASLNVPFINIKLQQNAELVQMVDQMYKSVSTQDNAVDMKPVVNELLAQPTIKMSIMGRAFSGKKTVAKQM